MKTKFAVLAFAFIFGTTAASFAGNHPALTYPAGQFATTGGTVEVTPWHKNVLAYQGGVVTPGPWYGYCPVAGKANAFSSKHPGVEVALSNGKKMMVCCVPCKDDAEKDLAKYKAFIY